LKIEKKNGEKGRNKERRRKEGIYYHLLVLAHTAQKAKQNL